MDQEQSSQSWVRELGLIIEIDEAVAARIKAELLIVHGLLLQGAYRRSDKFTSDRHLYAAYQVIASEIVNANTPSEVIESMIPHVVLEFSKTVRWWTHVPDLARIKRYLQGPITEWSGRKLRMQAESSSQFGKRQTFPRRAAWLKQRLKERGWDHNDPIRFNGPDRKTIQKILRGAKVREEVLEKLANALNSKTSKVLLLDIPSD
jgi:hypothetical protein